MRTYILLELPETAELLLLGLTKQYSVQHLVFFFPSLPNA